MYSTRKGDPMHAKQKIMHYLDARGGKDAAPLLLSS